MERKHYKYMHGDIQNELLEIMALEVLRDLLDEIRQSKFFSYMCDETSDLSNLEQLVVCIRWIDEWFEAHEDFIGLVQVASTTSDSLLSISTDVLTRCNLSWCNCRGQGYDGANAMKGAQNGLSTKVKRIEPRQVLSCLFS